MREPTLVKSAIDIEVIPVSVLEKEKDDKILEKQNRDKDTDKVYSSLATHIKDCYKESSDYKTTVVTTGQLSIYDRLLECRRIRDGVYSSTELAKINAYGGCDIFLQISDSKCRACESWLIDVVFPSGEKPFSFQPTTLPELAPEEELLIKTQVLDEAKAELQQTFMQNQGLTSYNLFQILEKYRVKQKKLTYDRAAIGVAALEDEVNDELEEGGWYKAIEECISDLTTYPSCFIKGPIVRKQRGIEWKFDEATGSSVPERTYVYRRTYERVSPFDIFISPYARNIQEGYVIQVHHYMRHQLEEMIGVDGFNEENIREALKEYGKGGLRDHTETDYPNLWNSGTSKSESVIDCVEYWGSAQGQTLLDYGMKENEIPDPDVDYFITAIVCGDYVLMARLNQNPIGSKPFHSTSFVKDADSIWGKGLVDLMKDIQRVENSCTRALIDNLSLASGPQVYLNRDRIPEFNDTTTIYPRKIWVFQDQDLEKGLPIGFFNIPSNASELINVIDFWYKMSSEVTSVPSYWYGQDMSSGIGGGTASGLSMLMNAATKGLKRIARNFDVDIIKPTVYDHWLHLMITSPQKTIGDLNIVPRASEYLIMLDQIQRTRLEFLQLTANPVDMEIIGKEGRAHVLREVAGKLKMDVDKIIPQTPMQQTQNNDIAQILNMISQKTGTPVDQLMAMINGGNQQQPAIPQSNQAEVNPGMNRIGNQGNIKKQPLPLPNGAQNGVQFG